MRQWINLVTENVGNQIRLIDIYSPSELSDESEVIAHEVSPMEWDQPLTVKTMTPDEAKRVESRHPGLSLIDSYTKDASKKQKKIVADKIAKYDEERIVVLSGDTIIDGNHHVIAGILGGKPILYVDLAEWEDGLTESESIERLPKPYAVVEYDDGAEMQAANVYKNPNAGLLKKLIGPYDCRALIDESTGDLYVWSRLDCFHDDVMKALNIVRSERLMLCNPDGNHAYAKVSVKGLSREDDPQPAEPEITALLHRNRGLRNLFGADFEVDSYDWG